ncbi:MAG: High-affinity nickel-transporter [Actinomycetota bacterium]|nr:High-affinity nickel-transporter [Actinomycetota bacterium]
MTRLHRGVAILGVAAVAALWPAAAASAHPLGNFTVNHYAGIEATPGQLRVVVAIDIAEIPTQQLRAEQDSDGDGRVSDDELQTWADATGADVAAGLHITVDGSGVRLSYECGTAEFRTGQAGLNVTRFEGLLTTPIADRSRVEVDDTTDADRTGWREITAAGVDGAVVTNSSVPVASVSDELRRYPNELLSSPLKVTTARFDVAPGASDASPAATCETDEASVGARPGVEGGPFAGLVTEQGLPLVALALLLALAFGAWHALLPGHGKTLMAACMVSSGAKVRQAVAVGTAIAVMHTVSVLALGLAVLALESAFRPETLYPWLGLASGLVALGLGTSLLIARIGAWMESRRHVHDGAHDHGLAGHTHPHVAPDGGALSRRGLAALALGGGILPAPSALIVMLGAIGAHRVAFGLSLVVAFSAGLAGALIVIGLGALRAREAMAARLSSFWGHMVPVLSAGAIVAVGGFLSLRGLVQI